MGNAEYKYEIASDNIIQFPSGSEQQYTLTMAQIQSMIQVAVDGALNKKETKRAPKNTAPCNSRGIKKPKAAEPMYSAEQFQQLGQQLLKNRHGERDYMMWVLGCTIGCRGGDLCEARIRDVLNENGQVKKYFELYEEKTGKYNSSVITEGAREAIEKYIATLKGKYSMGDYLVRSQKGGKMDMSQMYRILNKAAVEIGLPQNIGTHTMRKTYGYIARKTIEDDSVMDMLQTKYNHSDQRITSRYLTITKEEMTELSNTVNSALFK